MLSTEKELNPVKNPIIPYARVFREQDVPRSQGEAVCVERLQEQGLASGGHGKKSAHALLTGQHHQFHRPEQGAKGALKTIRALREAKAERASFLQFRVPESNAFHQCGFGNHLAAGEPAEAHFKAARGTKQCPGIELIGTC